ncbi:Aste57867_22162 [Aphanomyces stellatus]|uniref:ETFB lysine methyltransferase n=1 Tax=Aphanomyces stellatus TaxID=120398 RepID=A0A485LJF9_9STRA|nr:hypothetical protein As57867_022093 [Aphanomyces stellatus]VFT98829.1 Aste57867_22162 [Aphanomyces stellatus]
MFAGKCWHVARLLCRPRTNSRHFASSPGIITKEVLATSPNKYIGEFLTPEFLHGITAHTEAAAIDCVHLAPYSFQLITPNCPLYTASADEAKTYPFPDPFWGFCWPGSYALCRYVQEHPEVVEGKIVLDFAAGGGMASIMSLYLGARVAIANDIDRWSCAASLVNTLVNLPPSHHAAMHVVADNLIGHSIAQVASTILTDETLDPTDWVVLAGDVCYEEPLATDVMSWLATWARGGVRVLIGDPGRQFLPQAQLTEVATYPLPPTLAQDNYGLPVGAVWSINAT